MSGEDFKLWYHRNDIKIDYKDFIELPEDEIRNNYDHYRVVNTPLEDDESGDDEEVM